jgi:uncharacterized membrane protein YfcA
MLSPATAHASVIALTFLIAGAVKGVTGMGLPTVAMGVLGTLMLPAEAASLLILPSVITNVWQLLAGPNIVMLMKRFWPMMTGVVVGTLAASSFIAGNGGTWAVTGLGAALTIYAASGLLAWRFSVSPRRERLLSPVIGVVTGLITGGTGVFVVPAVPYLQALDLKKEDLVQALGLSFTVSTAALAIGLFRTGALASPTEQLAGSILALVPALAGMFIGQALRQKMSVETFRKVFFVGLLALGAYLVVEALW